MKKKNTLVVFAVICSLMVISLGITAACMLSLPFTNYEERNDEQIKEAIEGDLEIDSLLLLASGSSNSYLLKENSKAHYIYYAYGYCQSEEVFGIISDNPSEKAYKVNWPFVANFPEIIESYKKDFNSDFDLNNPKLTKRENDLVKIDDNLNDSSQGHVEQLDFPLHLVIENVIIYQQNEKLVFVKGK